MTLPENERASLTFVFLIGLELLWKHEACCRWFASVFWNLSPQLGEGFLSRKEAQVVLTQAIIIFFLRSIFWTVVLFFRINMLLSVLTRSASSHLCDISDEPTW